MEFEFPVTETFEACIRRVEHIKQLGVGQPIHARLNMELDELKRELIENETESFHEKKSLQEAKSTQHTLQEENEEDFMKSLGRHDKEIFRLDEKIENLEDVVVELRETMERKLEQNVQNFTTQLEHTRNELFELQEIVNH